MQLKTAQEQARKRRMIQVEDHEDHNPLHIVINDRKLKSLTLKDFQTLLTEEIQQLQEKNNFTWTSAELTWSFSAVQQKKQDKECYNERYYILYTLPTFFSTKWDLKILTNAVYVVQVKILHRTPFLRISPKKSQSGNQRKARLN